MRSNSILITPNYIPSSHFIRYLSDLEKVNVTMSGTREHVLMVNYLRSLEGSLDEEEAQFNVFWGQHKAILDHQMKLGYFLRSVDKVWLSNILKISIVTTLTTPLLGERCT